MQKFFIYGSNDLLPGDWILSLSLTVICHLKIYSLQVAATLVMLLLILLSNSAIFQHEHFPFRWCPSRNYGLYIIIHGASEVYSYGIQTVFFPLMNVGCSRQEYVGSVVNEDESCRLVTDVQVPKKLHSLHPCSNWIRFAYLFVFTAFRHLSTVYI